MWRRKADRGRVGAIAAAVVLGFNASAAIADPAYSYRSPFHPEQCEKAIVAGRRAVAADAENRRARLILAEGLLCRGLQGDSQALDAAIALLEQTVTDEPANFFAQLELADALRQRSPVSEQAERALQHARDLLAAADVGAARQELAAYIDENLAAVAQSRAVTGEWKCSADAPKPPSPAPPAGEACPEPVEGIEVRVPTNFQRRAD